MPGEMQQYRYPTAFSAWDAKEHLAIDVVLKSGKLTMGPRVKEFEDAFAQFHGKRFGIMVNSGSSANLIAVAALSALGKFKAGDTVAVPAMAWSTTYAPLVQYGLKIQLMDINSTWNSPVQSLGEHVKLIVACSILGNPAYLEDWKHLAHIKGIPLLEDNCESFGAATPSNLCGTYGDLSTFSFFYSHQISGIEGGMILTNDPSLARMCKILRAHGWTRDTSPQDKPFDEEYDFVAFGYNVRPLEMHAAVSHQQLQKWEEFRICRDMNKKYFEQVTERLPIVHQKARECCILNSFGLSFTLPSHDMREPLAKALRANKIDCRLPTGGSFRKHVYGAMCSRQYTPVADHVHMCGMFLGNAPYDIRPLIDDAVGVMEEFFQHG